MIIRSLPGPSSSVRLLCYFSATTRILSFPSSPTPNSLLTLLPKSKSNSLLGGKLKVRLTATYLSVRSMSSSSPPSVFFSETEKKVDLLTATEDDHGGVIVDMTNQPLDPAVFTSLLRASLSHWKLQGKKGVWIKVPIELVNLVKPAVKEGFYYHHAEPKYLMLVYWIPETPNTLPVNASHRVGIGAFVMKENGEVLVVQEKSGILRGSGIWKFPTGVIEEGEDICDAAVREVKEETGIDAKFVEILGFRQSHKSFFEKSDLFFMCMLQPLSFDIQMQETEIEAAEWMPFEKYAAQPFVQKHDLLKYIVNVCVAKMDKKYTGFSPVPTVSNFSNEKGFFYLNKQSLDST